MRACCRRCSFPRRRVRSACWSSAVRRRLDVAVDAGDAVADAVRLVLAGLLGVVLGAAIGSSGTARDYLGPTLEFFRPLPASAIIPVAILFLGLTQQMSLAVIAFGAIWPVLLGSVYGFSTIKSRLREVARARDEPARILPAHRVAVGAARHHLRRAHQPRDRADPGVVVGDAGVAARARARTSCRRSAASAAPISMPA